MNIGFEGVEFEYEDGELFIMIGCCSVQLSNVSTSQLCAWLELLKLTEKLKAENDLAVAEKKLPFR